MIRFYYVCLIGLCAQFSFSQDTLLEVEVISKKLEFKNMSLYDNYEVNATPNIRGFEQLELYENSFSDEIWFTDNLSCINVKQESDGLDTYLHLEWNKDQEGCDWVGMGFGWDFWTAKNITEVIDTLAIELEVRSIGKQMGNLPWALCFEDYGGGQSWIGFSKSFIEGEVISTDWTKVRIPLGKFSFEDSECDPSSVKQMIIQFFAEDQLEINYVKLVPFSGKLKQEAISTFMKAETVAIDGLDNEWKNANYTEFGPGHSFAVLHSEDSLYLAIKVTDETPGMNRNEGSNLWKGDAVEIAFSTNPTANPKRKSFLLSDYHIGVNLGDNPYLWNWPEDTAFEQASFFVSDTRVGYFIELAIPLAEITNKSLTQIDNLNFEIAIDASNDGSSREKQYRWSSSGDEGFNVNPSLWGSLVLEK